MVGTMFDIDGIESLCAALEKASFHLKKQTRVPGDIDDPVEMIKTLSKLSRAADLVAQALAKLIDDKPDHSLPN